MIKYEIKTGDKALNTHARGIRDISKIQLRGMHCKKCTGVDTIIRFLPDPALYACCSEFEKRIREKLKEPL